MESIYRKIYSNGVKKGLFLILIALISINLFAVSFIKDPNFDNSPITLLSSYIEADNFSFPTPLSRSEENFYNNLEFYLYTGGPGSLVWENFGHSGIIVNYLDSNTQIMFDFGIFQFDESFYKNFALGKLYYLGLATNAHSRVDSLISDDRKASFVKLELTPIEKMRLFTFLAETTSTGHNTYLYDYYFDNCATRLRDAYDIAKDGEFKSWAEKIESKETLRDLSIKYLSRSTFFVDWAINYLLGPVVDQKITLWEASFIPEILEKAISEYQGTNIVVEYESGRKETDEHYPFVFYSFLLSLFVGIMVILSQNKKHYISGLFDFILFLVYFVLFIVSLCLLFFMVFSIHKVTYFNANILLINPLFIVLSICHLIAVFKPRKRKVLSVLSSVLLLFTISLFIFKGVFISYMIQDDFVYYMLVITIYLLESLPFIRKFKIQ